MNLSTAGQADLIRVGLFYVALALVFYFLFFDEKSKPPSPPGWDDLELCSLSTSIDGKKSLQLSDDRTAEIIDRTDDQNTVIRKGRWELRNAQHHVYLIEVESRREIYYVVSLPPPTDCILGFGESLSAINLQRSWFPEEPPPPERDQYPF